MGIVTFWALILNQTKFVMKHNSLLIVINVIILLIALWVWVEGLEKIFSLLVLGAFVGLPSPPMQISLELMPLMEKDLIAMIQGVDTAHEPISYLFSTFDIG